MDKLVYITQEELIELAGSYELTTFVIDTKLSVEKMDKWDLYLLLLSNREGLSTRNINSLNQISKTEIANDLRRFNGT